MKLAFSFAVVLVLFLTAVGQGREDKEAAKLDGTWIPASAEFAGAKLPDEALKTMKLILKDDAYTVMAGEKTDKGTLKLDTSKKPGKMDITGTEGPNKGKTFLAIYELTNDGLKICYDLGGKERPTEFMTKADSQLLLITYKREK